MTRSFLPLLLVNLSRGYRTYESMLPMQGPEFSGEKGKAVDWYNFPGRVVRSALRISCEPGDVLICLCLCVGCTKSPCRNHEI